MMMMMKSQFDFFKYARKTEWLVRKFLLHSSEWENRNIDGLMGQITPQTTE